MPAESSSAIDEAVQLITKEMGEVSPRIRETRERRLTPNPSQQLDVIIANAGICIHQDAEKMTDSAFGAPQLSFTMRC